ncbi:MAG: proline--tRNA ligase [Candidatus Omnitrophota bacterium]
MRWTQSLIPTHKEEPQDAETISHKLMARGGFIRKLTAGAYTYLPLGWRVMLKITAIIREEMNAVAGQEVLMPAIHPPELWKKTGRYDILGDVMIRFKDRHKKELLLGPTHEEVITDIVSAEVKSYRELPLILYQIQTKFRDEPRPRFGILRTCEFIMKDAYSFDRDIEGLELSYRQVFDAYCRIFERCGLPYIAVEADSGIMGGRVSHEFMVPAENGEDEIVVCKSCKYSASLAVAACKEKEKKERTIKRLPLSEVETPGVASVEGVAEFLRIETDKIVKTVIFVADGKAVAVLVRGDHEVNETKIKSYLKCGTLELADVSNIQKITGGPMGFSGPVNLPDGRILADYGIVEMANFVTGANKKDTHLINVNIKRDFEAKETGDFRLFKNDDACPKCNRKVEIRKAIEIGHTFKLGTKYTEALGANYLSKEGTSIPVVMGCYGIGLNRIAASLIESSNDKDGIIWPLSISPYQVVVMPLNIQSGIVRKMSDQIYKKAVKAGFDVLYDDRDQRAGIKFKDADLIGFPVQVIIGERNASQGLVEIKIRKTQKSTAVKAETIIKELKIILDNG